MTDPETIQRIRRNISIQRILRRIENVLTGFAIAITIGTVVVGFLMLQFGTHNHTVIYRLILLDADFGNDFLSLFGLTFIVSLPLIFAAVAITRRLSKGKLHFGSRLLPVMTIAVLGVCGCWIPATATRPHVAHVATTRMDNHLYHLAFISYDIVEGGYHHLYRCDRFDIFCSQVYTTWNFRLNEAEDRRLPYLTLDTTGSALLPDPDQNTITVVINGETVYTYDALE